MEKNGPTFAVPGEAQNQIRRESGGGGGGGGNVGGGREGGTSSLVCINILQNSYIEQTYMKTFAYFVRFPANLRVRLEWVAQVCRDANLSGRGRFSSHLAVSLPKVRHKFSTRLDFKLHGNSLSD